MISNFLERKIKFHFFQKLGVIKENRYQFQNKEKKEGGGTKIVLETYYFIRVEEIFGCQETFLKKHTAICELGAILHDHLLV